jgi:hypothetical protein
MNFLTKNIINILVILLLILPSFSFSQNSKIEDLGIVDKASVAIYCFFLDCESDPISIEKKEQIARDNKQEEQLLKVIDNKDNNITVKKEIINNTKYINQGKTIVKKYYNTIEKQPIINNTYPKEIIEKKIVEEFDSNSLRKKINSNRRMISQLAGLDTSDDDLSDNNLNDLNDVAANPNTNGQVLT